MRQRRVHEERTSRRDRTVWRSAAKCAGASAAIRVAALLGVAALVAWPVGAQGSASRDALWSLLQLPGKYVSVRYSPGSLDRASRVQQRLDPLIQQIGTWARQPAPLAVYLVSREEWEQMAIPLPYGFPARLPGRLLVLAAWGDDESSELWKELLNGQLPEAEAGFASIGSPSALASLEVCDVLGSVEASRIALEKVGVAGEELWISELMAHAAYLSFRWQGRPRGGSDEDVRTATATRQGGALPLSAYETGLSMEDWLWFQSAFHRGARTIIERGGDKAGRWLVREASKEGGRLRRSTLIDRYPELLDWLRGSFAPETAGP